MAQKNFKFGKLKYTDGKFWLVLSIAFLCATILFILWGFLEVKNESFRVLGDSEKGDIKPIPVLDTKDYDARMIALANNPILKIATTTKRVSTSTVITIPATTTIKKTGWPVQTPYPLAGAILPFKRIIAYYGNLYSKGMGVLGQYPEAEMLAKLDVEVAKWTAADPNTPAIPALHYIAVTAQGSAGADGKYRARMPYTEIDKVLAIAAKRDALVFLDVQVAFSTVQIEIPLLDKYLQMPQVHLGIDPEFSMKHGIRPGKEIGTFDAADINFVIDHLAKIVQDNHLPPKILIVHRFTQAMITNYKQIKTVPEVQVVIDMDGWGVAPKKINTYQQFVYGEPVEFTGFKLFYKNDTQTGTPLMTPEQLLKLNPRPIYIQYQ